MKRYLLVVILFFAINGYAQTDTIFWFAAPDITSSNQCGPADLPVLLQITAYSSPSFVTISQPAGGFTPITLNIPANTTITYDLSPNINNIEVAPANLVVNKGIKITSTNPVSIYVEYTSNCNPEIYVLKGQNAIGNAFYITSQSFWDNVGVLPIPYNSFNIVSTDDNNIVSITPSHNILGHLANITFNITLQKGQCYAALATSLLSTQHLGGSLINSTKPIAVTLADDMLGGGVYGGCADQAGDQTIPVSQIGNEYIAVKGNLNGDDKINLTSTQNGTTLNIDGIYSTTLNAGQNYEISLANSSTYIQTNNPIYCFQTSGIGCELGQAVLPQINCSGSSSVSLSRTTQEDLIITLLVKVGGEGNFLINGLSGIISSGQFSFVPGTSNQWMFAKIYLPIANYPFGSIINISNNSNLFHMGVLQGGPTSGASFGYFSDFNTFQAHATANNTNPCVGNQLQLFADTVVSATYTWTGPNGFTSIQQNPTINNYQAINAGNYILEVSIPGCSISYDTLQISTCNIDTCKTTQITLNTGVDANGNLLPIGAQDLNWKVTNIQNSYNQLGYNIPYHPLVNPGAGYYTSSSAQFLSHSTTNCLSGQPGTGPADPVYEITRHFTTIQDDTFLVNVNFAVDNYINYFSVDGIILYSMLPTASTSTFTSPNLAINNMTIFLPAGCHDITCSYADYNGNTINTQACSGIYIEGSILSIYNDSSILKQSCVTNTPPTLNATDTLNYCANCEYISPNLSITSGLDCGNLDTVKVYFTSGYTQGQDTLQFAPMFGINSYFNPSTGVLTLYGNANYGVWETVLRNVCYSSLVPNNSNVNATKNVVIVLGDALYNPANGNFYKYVKKGYNISWQQAVTECSTSTHFGQQGYLTTITSSSENAFILNMIDDYSFIGASDEVQEGIWRWRTGCEGLEDGGQGRHFATQNKTGVLTANPATIIGGYYSNWTTWISSGNPSNMPDDFGCSPPGAHCEDYAGIFPISQPSNTNYIGGWNDGGNSGQNYIIEYGCMPGDPFVNLASSIKINILQHQDTIVNQTICQGDSFLNYSLAGTWTDTFTSASGCDSLRILNLNVQTINIIQNDTSICSSSSIPLNVVTTNATNTIANFCGINYLPANLKNGLFAYYPFCGNSLDESGNGHNGTTYGAVLSTDRFGNTNQSYVFNAGISSHITTNYIASGISNNFTYSAWVNPNLSQTIPPEGVDLFSTSQMGLISDGQCIIHPVHGSVFGNVTQDAGAGLYLGNNGVYIIEHSDGLVRVSLAYSTILSGWHNYAIVYDNKTPILYVDGVLVHTGIAGTRDIFPSVGYDNNTYANYLNSGFGAGFNGLALNSTQYFDGKMDELSFWNRKLSVSEISQLYNYTSTALQPVLTWSTGDTTNNIFVNNNMTTTYYCTINGSGCMDSVQITINPIILDTIYNTICQGDTFLNHYTSGNWTDTFTIASGCDSIINYNLTVNPIPNVTASGTNAICIGQQQVTLNGNGASSYTWSGGVINGVSFNLATTTTFTVTGTDVTGCTNTATKTVTVNTLPNISPLISPNDTICNGTSITLNGTGATSYTWSGGVNNGVSFVPASTATYTVTGTDANGCSNTNTILIIVNPLPTISINSLPNPPTICIGASISLTASGANTYAWSGGISNGLAFNPVASTTYIVTGTDANNCSNTNSIAVTVNPLPNVNSTPAVATVCFGQSMTLNGTGASTYTWSGGVINNSPFTISNTTTYTVTGTDANGCSNTNTKLVTVNIIPTLSISPTNPSICLNQNVNLTAGGANTYSWSPGLGLNQTTGATVNAGPTVTTTYTITGMDVNGCSNTISNTVNVNPLPVFTTSPSSATICQLDSSILSVFGAFTFSWSPAAGLNTVSGNTVKASPSSSTTYTITGTNANGCTSTQTVSVIVNSLPILSISPANPSICYSESIMMTASGATTYSWSPATGLNNTTLATVLATPASTQTYNITGTDANGCSKTISTTLVVNPLPVLSVTPVNPSICIGNAVNMSCNGANTYLWSPSAGLNTTVGNNVQANPTNTTVYKIVGTSNQGCKDSITNTVTVNPLPNLTVSTISTTICQGQTTTLTVNGATTYAWAPGGSLNTATGNIVQATPYLTTIYTITGTDINACTNTSSIIVNVNPSYTIQDTIELCQGMSYAFGNQTISSAGNYTYTFQTVLSCDSIVNLHVIVHEKPIAGFTLDKDVCIQEAITIQNNWSSTNATYNWNVGDGIITTNTPSINVAWTLPGTKIVTLQVNTSNPCIPVSYLDTIEVHEAQAKILLTDQDSIYCIYDNVKLHTQYIDGYSYVWSPSTYFNSNIYKAEGIVKEPVTVRVKVKDEWGCEAEDSKYLNVEPCCNAYLPNSFSPNGDGVNDVFRIIGYGNYHILDFYVANRWGNIIFKTIDQNTGWDGTINGIEQSMDTYYYYLRYECANGEKRFIKGDLTLLR